MLRNGALLGLAGIEGETPDSLEYFEDEFAPAFRQTPEERRAIVAALLGAG